MNIDKAKRFERNLFWGIILIDLLFASMAIIFLVNSRAHYEDDLKMTGHNLVQLLEQCIADKARLIDDAVERVERELDRQMAAGSIDVTRLEQLLESEQVQLPEIDAIRITNAAGDVRWGKGVVSGVAVSYADREFFKSHREHTKSDLIITEPLKGKVSGVWIIGFTRCYHTADGKFGGVISAAVPVDTFGELLTTLNLGKRGTVVLRYADMGLIARVPPIDGPAGQPGHKKVSAEFTKLIESGLPVATFHTAKTPDSVERTYAFRRVSGRPFTIAVGLADDDYLAPWWIEAIWVSVMLVGFLLVTSIFLWMAVRGLHERTAMEEARIEDMTRRRVLIEQSRDGIVVVDHQGKVWEANRCFAKMLGYTPEEVQQLHVWDWDTQWTREQSMQMIEQIDAAGDHFETQHRRKDGTVFDVEVSINGAVLGGQKLVFSVCRDISKRKRAEEERLRLEQRIQQVEKAESLGRMAGAIAHHFNNLLGVVMGNLELGMLDLPSGAKARAYVAKAMTASRRAAEISRLMLAYLGQDIGARTPTNLSEVCRETLAVLADSLPEKVHLKIDFPDVGPIIRANALQIMKILTNLVVNAGEAMDDREGEVTVAVHVKLANDIRGSHFYPPEWEPKEESYACFSVSDTGGGMDKSMIEKIFDPFFSTKFTGRGLGLAVLLGMVKAHEGAVVVESAPGQGAVFRVFLPLSAEEPQLPRKAELDVTA
jgi:PAS domain S-box-containing protein